MKKILFFVPSLGSGGAEMQVLRLANHLDRREFSCTIAVARDGGSYERRLKSDVSLVCCGISKLPSSFWRVALSRLRLRDLIRQLNPDIAIGYVDHASATLARALNVGSRSRPRLLIGLQNNLARTLNEVPAWSGRWLRREILNAYKSADHVIAISEGAAGALREIMPDTSSRMSVIYNAAYEETLFSAAAEEPDLKLPEGNVIVACGRLTRQKNFSLLLRAFATVLRTADASLYLLGDGELRGQLQAQAISLGIGDRVCFAGFKANPYAYMRRATAFVLSSDWEGFGNVLAEAIACGAPVIATDCPFGPREILEGGLWGDLVSVGDEAALGAAMLRALQMPDVYRARALLARSRIVERFESGRIARCHEALFYKLLA